MRTNTKTVELYTYVNTTKMSPFDSHLSILNCAMNNINLDFVHDGVMIPIIELEAKR